MQMTTIYRILQNEIEFIKKKVSTNIFFVYVHVSEKVFSENDLKYLLVAFEKINPILTSYVKGQLKQTVLLVKSDKLTVFERGHLVRSKSKVNALTVEYFLVIFVLNNSYLPLTLQSLQMFLGLL